jgi:hypothetical protein
MKRLNELLDKYNPHEFKDSIVRFPLDSNADNGTGTAEGLDAILTYQARFQASLETVRKISKKDRVALFYDLIDLLKISEFGYEWIPTLITLIIDRWFFPPRYNLHIRSDERIMGKGRVVLELNPDTSIEDVEAAWPAIEKKQKELWPNHKKTNLHKKAIENLSLWEKRMLMSLDNPGLSDMEAVVSLWGEDTDAPVKTDKARRARLRQIKHRSKPL